jgi:predicted methyltransferase
MRVTSNMLAATFFSLAATVACGQCCAAEAVPNYIKAALANPGRPPLEIERDVRMKPGEILAASGIKPGMSAAVLMPEGGYYTRILSGIVGPKGHVYAVVSTGQGDRDHRWGPMIKDVDQNMPLTRVALAFSAEDQPEFKNNVMTFWENVGNSFAVPTQLDLVLTANNYHVLKSPEFAKLDTVSMTKAIYRALKSGGEYLAIDNAAAKGAGAGAAALNRTDADLVKAEALSAGFVLDGESKALADASDDHTKAANAEGPADMFVLRFKKPANAPNTDKRPANIMQGMSGYFGNTRRGNTEAAGVVSGQRERRVLYHEDGTYQEYGAKGTGNNPFQSGLWFFDADGNGCMLHLFPEDQRGQTICSAGRAEPGHKAGETWVGDDGHKMEMVKGYLYFDDIAPNKN